MDFIWFQCSTFVKIQTVMVNSNNLGLGKYLNQATVWLKDCNDGISTLKEKNP